MSEDVKKTQKALPSEEKAKLDHYLDALEALQDQDVKIAALRAHGRQVGGRDIAPRIRGWALEEARRAPARKAAGRGRARRPKYAEAFRIMRLLKDEPTGDD